MQLRMSPGGRTSNSRRSRPELPPSSVTVTMAVMSMGGDEKRGGCLWLRIFLEPVEQGGEAGASADRHDAKRFRGAQRNAPLRREAMRRGDRDRAKHTTRGPTGSLLLFRIKEALKRKLFADLIEIGILSGDHSIPRLNFNGTLQTIIRALRVSAQRQADTQGIMHVVGARIHFERDFQMPARLSQVAHIDQRDGVIVMLLDRFGLRRRSRQAALAHANVRSGIRRDLQARPLTRLFKPIFRLAEVPLVKELDGPFEALQL